MSRHSNINPELKSSYQGEIKRVQLTLFNTFFFSFSSLTQLFHGPDVFLPRLLQKLMGNKTAFRKTKHPEKRLKQQAQDLAGGDMLSFTSKHAIIGSFHPSACKLLPTNWLGAGHGELKTSQSSNLERNLETGCFFH